jgi:predicted nucleotidyltransferase
MISLTENEKKILLIVFRDFTSYYNANTISKTIKISRIGAMKIFKKLLKENILHSKKIGKSIIYKPNLSDDYVKKLISFLLADEANNSRRWKEEFKGIFEGDRIVLLFGSAIRNYDAAHDIDLMVVLKKEDASKVNKILNEKNKILPKKLHKINLTAQDLSDNLKKRDKVVLDIIKNSVVLYGQDKFVEIIQNVTSF